jgi:CCR4-NOT transcription complex subunit 4
MIIISSHNFNPPSNAAYVTFANEKEASLAILVSKSALILGLRIVTDE